MHRGKINENFIRIRGCGSDRVTYTNTLLAACININKVY